MWIVGGRHRSETDNRVAKSGFRGSCTGESAPFHLSYSKSKESQVILLLAEFPLQEGDYWRLMALLINSFLCTSTRNRRDDWTVVPEQAILNA